MGERMRKAVQVVSWIWFIPFSAAAFLILGVISFTTVYYDFYQQVDLPRFTRENIPLLLVLTFLVLIILYFLQKQSTFSDDAVEKAAVPGKPLPLTGSMRIAMFWAGAVSLYLILIIRGRAVNDGLIMDRIVNDFMKGDYSSLQGGYLAIYPYQMGYIAIAQLLYVLFGPSNYIVYMLLNLLSVLITIWMLYEITWELFEKAEICSIAAMLSMGMLFLFSFTTFVYGDIWSFAPMSAGIYLSLRYFRYHRLKDEIAAIFWIGTGIVIKSNCYIAALAIAIMLLLDGLREIKTAGWRLLLQNLVLAAAIFVTAQVMTGIITMAYSRATGINPWPKGTPNSTFFAMGLQEAGGEFGWHNGYDSNTYSQNGFDYAKTDAVAKQEIRNRIRVFQQRPLHAAHYFVRKFLSQWADESCISMHDMEETSRHVTGQTEILHSILYGRGRVLFRWIMNLYQELCYLGTAVFCIGIFRKKHLDFNSAFIILFIFGGMLFHELWEASSRYTMRYYIFMLPLAAYGIDRLLKRMKLHRFAGITGKMGE
jgi:hypothetical protein